MAPILYAKYDSKCVRGLEYVGDSVGLDLHSPYNITINPGTSVRIDTGISVSMLRGHSCAVMNVGSYMLDRKLKVVEYMLEPNMLESIYVTIRNVGCSPQSIEALDGIAKLFVDNGVRADIRVV